MRYAVRARPHGRERYGVENDSNHGKIGVLCIPLHCKGVDARKVARYLSDMADHDPPKNKFAAYRARKKAAGLREVRMWVPDLESPEFRAEAARQAALLDKTEEEREISAFMVAAAAEAWDRE